MVVEYQIISSLRLVYVEMQRALSIEELVSHLQQLAADDNYIPPMKKIVDFSNTKDGPMPTYDIDDFDRLKVFYENELRGEQCVFVAPSAFSFGMGRVFGGYMDRAPIEVSVVRSLEAALALLGIKEDDFRASQRVKIPNNSFRDVENKI